MKKLSLDKIDKLLKNNEVDENLKKELKKKKEHLSNQNIIRKNGSN